MEGQYRLVPETLEALATLRREQCAAVKLAAADIVAGGLPESSGEFVWRLRELPLTNELAAGLVRASPEMLCELSQKPDGQLSWVADQARRIAGFGKGQAPSRQRLARLVSASEAVAAGTRLLQLVTEALSRGSPPPNSPRTLHACWELESTHRSDSERLYFSATLVEERYNDGSDSWQHSVEFFVAPPGSLGDHSGCLHEDDRATRAVRGVQGYEHMADTGHRASLRGEKGSGAKAASLLSYMMSPLLQKANDAVRNRAF